MRAKHWLALFLVMAMAASLAIIPVTAEENLLAGTGALEEKTVTFQVTADRENIIYTGGEEVITFTVDVANDSNKDLHAFSFVLQPSDGLTLATLDKDDEDNADADFYFLHGTGTEADKDMLDYYKTFEYTPDRCYFGAAKADKTNAAATTAGSAITLTSGAKTVLTIMGKISATGEYTLGLVTTGNDAVVAGQVNGTGSNTVSLYFERAVIPATVKVEAGGVISGTVTDGSAAVNGAVVTLKDSTGAQVGEPVTTGNDGKFTLPAVANGSYTVNVTAAVGEKTLRGSKSVTVDKYAVDAGSITVRQYQLGDVNKSDKVDIMDVERLYEHVQGINLLDDIGLSVADVNASSKIDIMDVERLYEHVQGINPLG